MLKLFSGEIKALFLPPNVTSLIQLLDQGVIETLKRIYRQKLLQMLITKLDWGMTVKDAFKQVTIKDLMYWIASESNEVTNSTIQKTWKNVLA